MADVKVVFPSSKLTIRPLDALRLDVLSVAALIGASLSTRLADLTDFQALVFDVVRVVSFSAIAWRVFTGYKRVYDRYQLFATRTLKEKTLASGFEAIRFLADEATQQQIKELLLVYSLMLGATETTTTNTQSKMNQNTTTSTSASAGASGTAASSPSVVVPGGDGDGQSDGGGDGGGDGGDGAGEKSSTVAWTRTDIEVACERFLESKFPEATPSVSSHLDDILSQLQALGLVDVTSDNRYAAIGSGEAQEVLKNKWDELFYSNK